MNGESRRYALDVSEPFFRLTTESVRIRSNETRKYQTLGTLVNARAAEATCTEHDPGVLRSHLETIPTEGDIRIYLRVKASSADSLADARDMLTKHLGTSVTLGETLSLLLFDYIVEKKAADVVEKLKDRGDLGDSGKTGDKGRPRSGGGNNPSLN